MCKDSKGSVKELAKRQRGLDARGNDPLATQRESSWAADFIRQPPGAAMADTVTFLKGLSIPSGSQKEQDRVNKFQAGLAGLGDAPDGMAFANFFANGTVTQFKEMVDDIMRPVGRQKATDDIDKKGRDKAVFVDRGRTADAPRMRRNSLTTRHVGITTSKDRTADTTNQYDGDYFHAQAMMRLQMDSATVKKFQASGAPYVGGASGTIHSIAVQMEITGGAPGTLAADKKAERERVLAMLSVQHVAAGHHSMAECLVAAKNHGYFEHVSDPLENYDLSMQQLEKHLEGLGLGSKGAKPLARATEAKATGKDEVKYRDRLSFVKTAFERYQDQLPPGDVQSIEGQIEAAKAEAERGKHGRAAKMLAKVDNLVRGKAALIAAEASGSNRVPTAAELKERMAKAKAAAGKAKEPSAEYKAVSEALGKYQSSMKQIGGRKMSHDRAALAFEELRSELAEAETAIDAYIEAFKKKNAKKAGGDGGDQAQQPADGYVQAMGETKAKLRAEMMLLRKAEGEVGSAEAAPNGYETQLGEITLAATLEYARFGINPGTQGRLGELTQGRIGEKKLLGQGGLNTVALVEYKAEGGRPAERVAFKPEPDQVAGSVTDMLDRVGIDPANPKFGKRNIASKKMAQAAGLGGLIPDAAFTIVDGQVGLAMAKVNGEPRVKREAIDIDDPLEYDLGAAIKAKNAGAADWAKLMPDKIAGKRIWFEEETGKFKTQKLVTTEMPMKPPAEPRKVAAMQKQLINLQWLDALCGQTDRHNENYIVDMTQDLPVVVGIDNDFSFGAKRSDPEARQSNSRGFPPIIDQDTYDKLTAMDWAATEASLLDELYSTEEKAGIASRRMAVQSRMQTVGADVASLQAGSASRHAEAEAIQQEVEVIEAMMALVQEDLPADANIPADPDPAMQTALESLEKLRKQHAEQLKGAAKVKADDDRLVQLQAQLTTDLPGQLASITPEIAAAKTRFDKTREKLAALKKEGRVVQSWSDTVNGMSITDFLQDPATPDTYYRRDANVA